MENAAKALEIAAGVILAVILMSLISYFFSTISEWPQQEEDTASAEQLAKFNLEYEVYEKSAMYGVDVISCLNKARSNNEKYVEGGGFLTGSKYDSSYIINVYVSINEPLEEIIEIYYFDYDSNKEDQRFKEDDVINSITNKRNEYYLLPNEQRKMDVLNLPQMDNPNYYTDFTKNDLLWTSKKTLDNSSKYMVPGGGNTTKTLSDGTEKTYYSLMDINGKVDKTTSLYKLIEFSASNPKITVKNHDSNSFRAWSTAVWSTALYDFKTKRFTCDYIGYNESTGRINEIYFSEI